MPLKDTDIMPWGAHKGKAMINIPAHYLIWIYENNKCSGDVKKYIEDNMDVLKLEVKK